MRPISAIDCFVLLAGICVAAIGCEDTATYDYLCQAGDCFESECCDLTGEDVDGICIVLDPAAPPSLSGYCQSACHITDDCADGTVCLHPSPCDGDPRTKGVCTLVEDAPPTRVECPDERP
jgi:hypothetical protein